MSEPSNHFSLSPTASRNTRVLCIAVLLVAIGLVAGRISSKIHFSPSRAAAGPQPTGAAAAHTGLLVYVASPLGFADSTRAFMGNELIPSIKAADLRVYNPWDPDDDVTNRINAVKTEDQLDARRIKWAAVVDLLGERNARAIREADGVVAVLDGVDVDSGTAAEIGYATGLGKWVVGYRGDSRRTGEDQTAEVNLQVEYFIRKNGGVIVHSLDELTRELRERRKKQGG